MSNPDTLLDIVLVCPEIPQNAGAVGRLCVSLGWRLHLIRPFAFALDTARLRRAGLDYWDQVTVAVHANWDAYLARARPQRLRVASTRGSTSLYAQRFAPGDHLIFGNESSGLPASLYDRYAAELFRIPMPGPHARSLNLAMAVAVTAYEAHRQLSSVR